jgi:hypothetical protein
MLRLPVAEEPAMPVPSSRSALRRRLQSACAPLVLLGMLYGSAPAHAAVDCAALGPARQASLLGISLRETPDLGDAEANRIAAQLGHGACRAAADVALDALLAAAPDAPATRYLDAHRDLLSGRNDVATRKLSALLAAHPGHRPAKVLLAQALLETEQRDEARVHLADGGDDLRAAFLRLRLDALDTPKGEGGAKLDRILRDPAMLPELRESAANTVLYLTALDHARKEAALRELLRFESQTALWRKQVNLGRFLAEDQGKPAAAREALQPVLASAAPDEAKRDARVLIAESHLLDAVAIDRAPSERNAQHVALAKSAAGADMLALAQRIRSFHSLTPLRPFVADVSDPDVRDADGRTALCRAAQALDTAAVGAALDAGAAVDGECGGATALAFVVRAGPGDFARKRAVVEVLLARGAEPDPKLYPGATYTARRFCGDNFPDCERELLPLLDAAAARRGALPTP